MSVLSAQRQAPPGVEHHRQHSVELFDLAASTQHWSGMPCSWDLCVVLEGSGAWQYRRVLHDSAPGSVRLKEPGEPFCTPKVEQPMAFRIIRLSPAQVLQLLEPITPNPHLSIGQRSDPRLFQLICAAYTRLAEMRPGCLETDSIVHFLVTELLATALETPPRALPQIDRGRARAVRDFIEAHYEEELSLSTLAKLAGLHEVYVVRAFRELYGVPPHAYQLRRRVLAAREHLLAGMPPAEASLAVGFCDQSHLNRHFKRVLGLTPGKYQRSYRTFGPQAGSAR